MPQISPLVAGDPTELGSYRLSGRVGEGGQGIVYLGVNEQGERAAIKLLHVKFTGDTSARSRFARELKAAQRVASFCTARVIEADLDGDTPYIASEYIEGRALRDIVETDGPLSGTVLDRLAIGTATALTAIHHASIVHRDFKPDNVLIAADGPRVVDFGIARIIDSTGTITSRAIGTPAYMAPEQIAGDDIGPYTDVFSWGATIAFAATGTPAFDGKSIAVVLNRILNHEVDVSMMPEPLQSVVRSALAKSPAERPSADQILLRLLGQSTSVGASTAVLTRGVQVAGDDTKPFIRVPARSITDHQSRTGAVAPARPPAPPPPQRQEPAQPAAGPTVLPEGLPAVPPDRVPEEAPPSVTEFAAVRVSRRTRVWAVVGTALALIAAVVIAMAANDWAPLASGAQQTRSPAGAPSGQKPAPTYASVVEKAAQTGSIVIGVRGDLPGVALQNGGGFDGFDIDIARRIAAGLGVEEPTFTSVSGYDRAAALASGDVDLVVATYPIDGGDTQFAGPYYLAHQDVLVRAGGPIDKLADLKGKRMCAPNTPSVGVVQDRVAVEAVMAGDYAACMDLLRSGAVDAVPGDDLILAGFAAREPIRFKILGAKLTDERYAVGIRQGDVKTCKAVKALIADLYRTGFMKQLVTRHFGTVQFDAELKVPAMGTC
ncbi:serine/threonine-protein kinase [Nonomuraea maritima]|uniref:serine/threonine-protein kinase n=1 Tax=Nonomuraea maritima TaxID=683260 RepID=UPI003718FE93